MKEQSIRAKQSAIAAELAETWINGNRSDVIEALTEEGESDPIVAIDIALQIAGFFRDHVEHYRDLQGFEGIIANEAEARIADRLSDLADMEAERKL